jgi:hypothetical protein
VEILSLTATTGQTARRISFRRRPPLWPVRDNKGNPARAVFSVVPDANLNHLCPFFREPHRQCAPRRGRVVNTSQTGVKASCFHAVSMSAISYHKTRRVSIIHLCPLIDRKNESMKSWKFFRVWSTSRLPCGDSSFEMKLDIPCCRIALAFQPVPCSNMIAQDS